MKPRSKRSKVGADNRSRSLTKEERYEEILAAAAQVISRQGYRASSIHDIARELDLTAAALYHYVNSKEDLLVDICNRAGARLRDAAVETMALELPAVEKLRRLVYHHLALIESDRAIFTILLQERSELPADRIDVVSERAYFAIICKLLKEIDGRSGRDPRIAAYGLVGMLNWALRWYRRGGAYTLEEIGDQFFDIFVNGFAPGASVDPVA